MTRKFIPYGKQSLNDKDIASVVEVLHSSFLTQGPVVGQFEARIAEYCHASHGVAVNSGTSALHIACLALDVGEGDTVWTSPNTFVASANCALYCAAEVDFVDIDPATGNISIQALEQKLALAESAGKLPKVLIPVHFAGQPCDMRAIAQLGAYYGFRIIEDASHALGSRYMDTPTGACEFSDITVFSFHPVKIITSAEGGMAMTNDDQLANTMRLLASHGITRDPTQMSDPLPGQWVYQQTGLGFNYRLSELHAALGLSQAERIDEFVAARNQKARLYDEAFECSTIECLEQQSDWLNSYHLYVIRLAKADTRERIFNLLREKGIGVNLHYIPVYKQPYYLRKGFDADYCPGAEKYYQSALTLPLHPSLEAQEQQYVIDTVLEIDKQYS